MNLLWRTRISLRQKLALLALFSLTVITMVFAIVRVEVALRGAREDDSWFYLCTSLELTIGQLSKMYQFLCDKTDVHLPQLSLSPVLYLTDPSSPKTSGLARRGDTTPELLHSAIIQACLIRKQVPPELMEKTLIVRRQFTRGWRSYPWMLYMLGMTTLFSRKRKGWECWSRIEAGDTMRCRRL